MRARQKLVRNGNSTSVNIPRPMLIHLGWLPGEEMVVEILEDNSVRIRRLVERDFAPIAAPRMVFDDAETVTK
jgi:antitoxin component of MazEF toxin-antitoxin module